MAHGLRVWDASGNLTIDTSTRMTRILGVVYLPTGASGAITDAGFATGAPYWVPLRPDVTAPGPTVMLIPPEIYVSGTTLYYNLPDPTAPHIVVYGIC